MKAIVLGLALVLLSASASSAIDCNKAKTDLDKAICASPDLKAADDAMSKAYVAAAKLVGTKMAKVLKADQVNWIDQRMSWCIVNGDGNDASPEETSACLLRNTETRRKFLAGEPLQGPGAPDEKLVPQVLTGADGMFNEYMLFADPKSAGAKIFNKTLGIELKGIRMAQSDDKMSDSYMLSLVYLSPTLLSASVDVDQEEGMAHPMVSNHSINLDMTSGRPLTMDLMLDDAGLSAVQESCAIQYKDFIAEGEQGAEQAKETLALEVASLDHWTFGATAATVTHIEYGMDNPATCTIPYDQLRPLVKAGFPLPQ
jgi:uncharacterized protein YecT (DUF1311 family)